MSVRAENSAPQLPERAWWLLLGNDVDAAKKQPFPRWWSVWARSTLMGSCVTASIALFMVLHHPGDVGNALATTIVAGQLILSVVLLPASWWSGRVFGRVGAALAAGVCGEQLPRADVLATLRVSNGVFWTVWTLHVVFAAAFAIVAAFVPVLGSTVVDVVPGSVAMGLVSASSQASLIEFLVRRRVAPLLLPRDRLDHLVDDKGQLPRTFVWQLLAMLAGTLGIAWPLLVFTLFRSPGDPGVAKFVVLACLFLVLSGVLVAGLMAGIAGATGHLATRMDEVTAGNLSVQARVFGLDTFGILASDFNRMVEGLRQRELLKESFGRYVTQQVVDEVLAGRVALGGELKTATVLFSDIRGFTRMSEQLTPQEVVAFLNEYLEAMVDCVIEHGGILDKFIGDAVMAVFGAPVSVGTVAGDARGAIACAQAMQRRLVEINARRVSRGQTPIQIGIGIHTGPLVAGNIGSTRRMQYTVIGDTVNVGSRLESLTKEHHRSVLLSAATAELVGDRVPLVEVGKVLVRGRNEGLVIYGLQSEGQASAPIMVDATNDSLLDSILVP